MSEEVQVTFGRLMRQMTNDFRRDLKELDMTPAQLFMLDTLRRKGAMKISDLAEMIHVTVSAVTLLADRMIKLQQVERTRTDTDRRVVLLSITEEGLRILEQTRIIRRRVYGQYFSKLSPDEMVTLGHLLDKIVEDDH